MKRIAIVVAIAVLANLAALGIALAGDKMLEAKVINQTEGTGKSGLPYIRLIVEEHRELNGVKYTATVPVMVFNSKDLPRAKTIKPGDNIKAIVNQSDYQGRTSYTVQAFAN